MYRIFEMKKNECKILIYLILKIFKIIIEMNGFWLGDT